MENAARNFAPILVAVVHSVLNAEQFETIADLAEAVKCKAARLRIPYDAAGIAEALEAVKHTRKLLADEAPKPAPPAAETQGPIVSRELAADVLKAVRTRHETEQVGKPQPRGERLMRIWTLTRTRHHCGRCTQAIPLGTVALALALPKSGRTLWRCQACVGAPPVAVVVREEAAAVAVVRASFFERLKHLIGVPGPDVKTRQAGE